MRKLTLLLISAATISAAFFNVGTALAGTTTVGQAICGANLCGSNTPAGLDYQDWSAYSNGCHKNNLANPTFYVIDSPEEDIGDEFNRNGTTWWVADQGGETEGNGTCPDGSSTVIAKTMFYVNTSVGPDEWDDQHFPICSVGRNPCGSGRTAYYVELTAVPVNGQPVSAGGTMDTTRP